MRQPVRRVVTGHDEEGRARFVVDETLSLAGPPDAGFAAALIWTTAAVPADNGDPQDGAKREAGMTLKGGSVIRTVDAAPGFLSPAHRTLSIDYAVVVSGVLELELEDGEVRRMGPGDVVVQRGTLHTWRNPSATDWCRVVFILIEAAPLVIAGRALDLIDM